METDQSCVNEFISITPSIIMRKKNHTSEQIQKAMICLVLGDKPLRERVAEAMRYLVKTVSRKGFEQDFETIEQCFENAQLGDYSRVSNDQLTKVAITIMKMYRRLPFSEHSTP